MPLMSLLLSQPSDRADSQTPMWISTRRIPWALLAVLAASGVYLAIFYRIPISTVDEGMIASGAERIMRGQIPYRDFFSELGPTSFYLQAAIFRLAGTNISSFRMTAWILGVVMSGLIYFLGKQIIRGPGAFVPPFIFTTICYPQTYYVNHHWWGNLFSLLTLLCLTHHTTVAQNLSTVLQRYLLLVAGLLAALTMLTMQPKGAWAIFTGAIFLILAEKIPQARTWSQALRRGFSLNFWFLLGVGAMTALAVGYFWLHGALAAWIYDNFTFLFTNYLPYETWPGVYSWARFAHLTRWMIREPSRLSVLYFLGFYFFSVVAPAIGFSGAIWQMWRRKSGDELRSRLLLLFSLAGFGSLVSELHEPNLLHLVWASPIILILFVDAWNEAIRQWVGWRRPLIAAAVLAFALVALVTYRRATQAASLNSPIETRRGTVYADSKSAAMVQKWINTIEQAVPEGGETFFFPYHAQFYYLTATRNPTRYDFLLPDFHSPQQFEEAISSLKMRQPGCVFSFDQVMQGTPRARFPDDPPDFPSPDSMEKSLQAPQSHYRKVSDMEGMEVWTLKK